MFKRVSRLKHYSTYVIRNFASKSDVDDLCVFKYELCVTDENIVKLWSKLHKRVELSVTKFYCHMMF
jgi:hypothetical protein